MLIIYEENLKDFIHDFISVSLLYGLHDEFD